MYIYPYKFGLDLSIIYRDIIKTKNIAMSMLKGRGCTIYIILYLYE